jgi:hypothetical protein
MQKSDDRNPRWAKKRTKVRTPKSTKTQFLSHLKSAEPMNSHILENRFVYPLWFIPIDHQYFLSLSQYSWLTSDNSVKVYLNDEIYNGICSLDESNIFKFKCLCFVSTVYSKSKFKFKKEGHKTEGCYVKLYSKVSELIYGSHELPRIKKYLEDFGVLKVNHDCADLKLKTSKQYKISEKYFKDFFYARLYLPLKLVKGFFDKKRICGHLEPLSEIDQKRQNFLIESMKAVSLLPGYLNCALEAPIEARPNFIRHIDRYHDRRYSAKPDKKSGRWHTWATSCPRTLRRFILIDGEQTCEIDYGNMQPWLCLTFYSDADLKNPDVLDEISRYREISKKNEFYSFFAKRANVDILKGENKDEFKERVFKEIFFGPTNPNHQLWQFFCEAFPVLGRRITEIKAVDYRLSSIRLQAMEAKIVISGVLDKLIDREIHCLTVHDSIICKKSDIKEINQLMIEEFKAVMDDDPILKIK